MGSHNRSETSREFFRDFLFLMKLLLKGSNTFPVASRTIWRRMHVLFCSRRNLLIWSWVLFEEHPCLGSFLSSPLLQEDEFYFNFFYFRIYWTIFIYGILEFNFHLSSSLRSTRMVYLTNGPLFLQVSSLYPYHWWNVIIFIVLSSYLDT